MPPQRSENFTFTHSSVHIHTHARGGRRNSTPVCLPACPPRAEDSCNVMSGMPERMSSALRKQKEQSIPMSSNDMCIVDARTIAQASTKRDDCHHHRG